MPKDEAPGAATSPENRPGATAATRRSARPDKGGGRRRRRAAPAPEGVVPSELEARRERLAGEFAELQWDLGGLVYEMAARDHFRLDVVVRRAAKLQAVDAELADVERLLRLEEAGAAGNCPACGALYARGAAFCWQCGNDLMPAGRGATQPAPAPAPAPTQAPTPAETVGAKAAAVSHPPPRAP